jgi:GNAT superfamily N-acetyltransferase
MHVRLVRHSDLNELERLGLEYAEELKDTMPWVRIERDQLTYLINQVIEEANPVLFVIEQNGKLIGFMLASFAYFWHMAGKYCIVDIIYVSSRSRGSRAAALLMQEFEQWADRLNATISIGGNANKLYSERTARFYGHFGYDRMGYYMIKQRK